MIIMKKNIKVYSASDFKGMTSSIVVENTWWMIDHVDCTTIGEFSKTPLFELQLTQHGSTSNLDLPEGFEDGSSMIRRNRTYYVREGRPMYNQLAEMYSSCDGDMGVINAWVQGNWARTLFAGHVERLTGISYSRKTKRGTVVSSSKMEVWYPEDFEPGVIVDDFVFLCNKGVYIPVIDESKSDPMADAISKLDPELVKAILAMNK